MNITFIGMAGAGKSFMGKALAKKLGYKYLDFDAEIEKKYKMPLKELIEKYGEKGFIELEERIVIKHTRERDTIFSPGGSIIYSKDAMHHLRRFSLVVYLDVPFRVISKRVKCIIERGIIRRGAKDLRELYCKRKSFYKKYAHVTIKCGKDIPLNKVIKAIF
ncbi:MAG: shikimate kinase [Candidatus Firestonebacteria bacterium]|nr:shikimate kinase [Candidatus Firestonebacteria bacterium]